MMLQGEQDNIATLLNKKRRQVEATIVDIVLDKTEFMDNVLLVKAGAVSIEGIPLNETALLHAESGDRYMSLLAFCILFCH